MKESPILQNLPMVFCRVAVLFTAPKRAVMLPTKVSKFFAFSLTCAFQNTHGWYQSESLAVELGFVLLKVVLNRCAVPSHP